MASIFSRYVATFTAVSLAFLPVAQARAQSGMTSADQGDFTSGTSMGIDTILTLSNFLLKGESQVGAECDGSKVCASDSVPG